MDAFSYGFGLRTYARWTFGAFGIVLLQFTLVYLLTALALPDFSAPGPIDLRANDYQHSRWFFFIGAAMALASLLKELVLNGRLPWGGVRGAALHAPAVSAHSSREKSRGRPARRLR